MRALLSWILLSSLAVAADWRAELETAVAEAWRDHPLEAAAAAKAEPITTRNGMPRFVGEEVRNPHATPILLARVADPREDLGERVALVEAAVRSGGDWDGVVVGLLAEEPEPALRRMLAEVLREADPAEAAAGLARAAADPAAEVRAAAMRAIGGRKDGATLADALMPGLGDADAAVRRDAARALGWLGVAQGWAGIEPLLADPSAEVRLAALRALERLDRPRLARLPALRALDGDPDPRVARAAAAIR